MFKPGDRVAVNKKRYYETYDPRIHDLHWNDNWLNMEILGEDTDNGRGWWKVTYQGMWLSSHCWETADLDLIQDPGPWEKMLCLE